MSDDEVRAAFDVAEEIRDPLDGLADRSKLDKAAPFRPEVLERLAELRQDDRGGLRGASPSSQGKRRTVDSARRRD